MTHCRYFSLFIVLLLIVLSWWGPEVNRTRKALLGHSMGSEAVMSAAISVQSVFSL